MNSDAPRSRLASFTVDVEQDCPPYLSTCRGLSEGMPALLDMFRTAAVRATLFVTGEMARRFPEVIERLIREGHELGCHGDTHADFTRLGRDAADRELGASLATLRAFGPVSSFRAPYLRFPLEYLPLLPPHGITLDSSVARYKVGRNHDGAAAVAGLKRIPASITSSLLRLPPALILPWLRRLPPPLVLFVHPWEAVDFRQSRLRWDCRAGTGPEAVRRWHGIVTRLAREGFEFRPLRELSCEFQN